MVGRWQFQGNFPAFHRQPPVAVGKKAAGRIMTSTESASIYLPSSSGFQEKCETKDSISHDFPNTTFGINSECLLKSFVAHVASVCVFLSLPTVCWKIFKLLIQKDSFVDIVSVRFIDLT